MIRRLLLVVSLALIAGRAHAQCPATLAVSQPDANGIVTVVASTNGSCATTSLHLTLDGGNFDEKECPATECHWTTSIDAKCLGAYDPSAGLTHVVGLWTTCWTSSTDQEGHPTCVSPPNGNTSSAFTIDPKPAIHVDPGTLDEKGKGVATVTYSFPYNESFGEVRLAFDNHCCVTCGFCTHPEGTWVVPYSFTCGDPGTHSLVAQTFGCNGVNPSFIATDSASVDVSGQTSVHGSYDEDAKTLTVTSHFANTETPASGQRSISAFLDGHAVNIGVNGFDCVAQVTNTCTVNLALSCGTEHVVRLVANGCNRSEPMYNGEDSVVVTPICSNDTQCRHSPSTASELGAMLDSQNSGDSCDLCAGQPVHVGSGDVSITLPLFTIAGSPMSLPFTLNYHSLKPSFPATLDFPLGPGWTHPYNMSVRPAGGGSRLQYFTPTGNRLYFEQVSPSLWSASRPAFIADAITKDAGRYAVNYVNGGKSLFSAATGKWLSTVDRWGNAISGTYDAAGNLITIADPDGRQIALEYTNNLMTRISLPNGASWAFTYSVIGPKAMLTAISDPVNPSLHWRTFEYVLQSDGVYRSLSAMRDSAGKLIEGHNYEVSGDNKGFTSYSEGDKNYYFFDFGQPSPGHTRVTRDINDSTSQVTVYSLESIKGTYAATQIDGVCTSCGSVTDSQTKTYDSVGHVMSVTDAAGQTTRYSYAAFGNLLTRIEAAGTPRERTTTFAYEYPRWPSFVTRVTGNNGRVRQSQWNADETVLTNTDAGSGTTFTRTTTFDARHRVVREDGPRTDVADVTTRTWFSDGRLQQVTAPGGLTTSYASFDIYGTPLMITDPNGVATQLQTDLRGRVTSSTSLAVPGDPNEAAPYATSTAYDSQDRVAEVTNPRGAKTRYGYEDGTNALTDIVRVDFGGNEVERKHFTLNKAGDKVAEEDQLCVTPAAACGSWITRRSVAFAYDIKNRLVEIDQPVPAGAKVLYRYDANGRLQSSQDENHAAPNTAYTYDELSRLTSVTQASAITLYGYDVEGDLTSVTDPNGNVTTYAYDDFGRLQRQVSPVTGTTTYAYDPAGNLILTTDANGATTTRTYDAANRVLSSTSARSGVPSESVTWSYDGSNYGRGRLASMSDPTGTTTFRYERRGLLQSVTKTIEGNPYSTAFQYDAAGNRIRMTYPSGLIVNSTFDFADRPLSASLGSLFLMRSAVYAPFGPLTQLSFGNGTSKTAQLDARYRLLENRLAGPAGVIADYAYSDDAAGNVKEIHDAVDPTFNRDFSYDDLNRLTVANGGSALWGTGSYAYDAMGNLTALNIGRALTFSYVGSTPRLSNVAYDAAGNELSVAGEDFAYTARNSLAQTHQQQYLYDGRGVRTITFEKPPVSISGLQLSPPSVVGGSSANASVVLSGTTPADFLVAISRSGSLAAASPAEVTVPAGQASASFTITTTPVVATETATLSVSANGSSVSAVLSILPPPVTLASLALQPSSVVGGLSATGVVTLSAPAPVGGAVITLTSSDTSMATVPVSVILAAGVSTGTFAIVTYSTLVSALINVSASYNGLSQSAALAVTPPTTLSLLALAVDPMNVAGGGISVGTVTLSGSAPNGGVDVALASSDPAIAVVPSRVRVKGGDASATFTVNTFAVTSNAIVTISGSYGQLAQRDTLTVIPGTSIHLLSLTLSPPSVPGGSPSTGIVTIDSAAPAGGIAISVASKQKKIVSSPDSVIVPGGATIASFSIATKSVRRVDSAEIKVAWAGVTKSATLTLTPVASLRRRGGNTMLSLSVSAQMVSQPARRYSFYSPELNLVAESETTTASTPQIAYEYIWFNGQPLAQVKVSTGEVSWYFDDHLGTPILQTDANGSVVWRVEREPYGARYSVRAGKDRHQPLALPGQEDDATSDRSYNIFRWYRAGWGRYTQFDPIGNSYWPAAMSSRVYGRAPSIALPQITDPMRVHPFTYASANPVKNIDANGLRVQTRGCDSPATCLETQRTRPCCDCHDICFFRHDCSAGRDWAETAVYLGATLSGLAPVIPPPPCVVCNLWVSNCFVNAAFPGSRPMLCPWPQMPGTWPSGGYSGPPFY